MLMLDQSESIHGVTVYKDEKSPKTFYLLANQPRFRLDERGIPVFKFLKYKTPIERQGGKKGGGFVIFDVEFAVADDVLPKVKTELQKRVDNLPRINGRAQEAEIGTMYFKRGAASVAFLDSQGALVEKIQNPGSPSLYGRYITPITMELSPDGAEVAQAALQGLGGAVQVSYDLFTDVKLPPLHVSIWFNANKFMSFTQEIDVEDRFWSEDDYTETVREQFSASEAGDVKIDPGSVTDRKIIDQVTDWAWRTLEDGVKRMAVGDIAPVSEAGRKAPENYENVKRNMSVSKFASFSREFTQGNVMEWNPAPRGTLPNITNLAGKDGKPLLWKDFYAEVDTDSDFFKQLAVSMRVNADFEKLPLHSVEVHIDYPKKDGGKQIKEYVFTKPDDIAKFESYLENKSWKYKYSYEVNYKGASKKYSSPTFETEEGSLVINVDDTGILTVDMVSGDLDFDQVRAAQVTISYEDKANGVETIEQQFTIDKEHPEARFQKIIFQPMRNPYKYKVKYLMKDGKEFQIDWTNGHSNPLIVNDPWSATKTVGIRASGNLKEDIQTIFLDVTYTDEANKYTQTKSFALSEDESFVDWAFPVINEAGGKLVYSGTIKYRNGTEEEIKETETTKNTLIVGGGVRAFLEVDVLPDLIDFTKVKLCKVSLHYADPVNAIDARKDVVYRASLVEPAKWKVELKDKTKTDYEWKADFFLTDGTQKHTELKKTTEQTLLPELPM